jgi:hypothetical protein
MKRTALAGLFVLMIGCFGSILAQRGTAETTIAGKKVTIDYGQPSLQGRDMLGKLPVGGTWRMGMNAATTLETDGALKFGSTVIAPGKYELTAKRVSEDSFHLVFSKDGQTTEVPLSNKPSSESVETFMINLKSAGGNNGSFSMAWGAMHTGADFSVQ